MTEFSKCSCGCSIKKDGYCPMCNYKLQATKYDLFPDYPSVRCLEKSLFRHGRWTIRVDVE